MKNTITTTKVECDFENIENAIAIFQHLHDRAITCSNMNLNMDISKGEAKDALLEAHQAMVNVSSTVANMIKKSIDELEFARENISEVNKSIAI